MLEYFFAGGPYMWVLLLLAIVIVVIAIKRFIEILGKKQISGPHVQSGIDAILFWGSISAVLGILAHFHGIFQAMQAISQASDISPAVVAMGYAMSLTTIIFGLFIFLVSAILWFLLRWKHNGLSQKV